MGCGKDACSGALRGRSDRGQVIERMELRLPGKSQTGPRIEAHQRRARETFDAVESGPMGSGKLAVQQLGRLTWRKKEITVQPDEITGDLLFANNGLDAVDRRSVAAGGEPRPFRPVQPLDFKVAVIEGIAQVRGRALGLAPADSAIVQHDDRLALLSQQVRGSNPGDARTDDANIRVGVFQQRALSRRGGRCHPQRDALS